MRVPMIVLLALSSPVLAQEQIPLGDKVKGWFNMASSYITSAAASIPTPESASNLVIDRVVYNITLQNWHSVLAPSSSPKSTTPEEWYIYITGGNKTCHGLCGNTTTAWKETVPILSLKPNAPKFGQVDCDREPILCYSWAVGPPSLYHFLIPSTLPGQAKPPVVARYKPLNRTASSTASALNITQLVTLDKIREVAPYDGVYHPFNGWAFTSGLAIPVAYVIWAFSLMPSWMPMIIISLFSRTIMSRNRAQPRNAAAAPNGAAPQNAAN